MRDVTGIPNELLDVIARAIKLHVASYCESLVARLDSIERAVQAIPVFDARSSLQEDHANAIEALRQAQEEQTRRLAEHRRDLDEMNLSIQTSSAAITARFDAIQTASQREPVVNVTSFPVKDHTEAIVSLRRSHEDQTRQIAEDRREIGRLQGSFEAINERIKKIEAREPPRPKDGEPGRDAFELDVLPVIDFTRDYPRGTLAQHQGGLWRAYANTHGEHGWSCVVEGIATTHVTMDSERSFTVHIERSGGAHETATFSLPVMIYRGVFVAGETYKAGDVVTWAGSLWHCNATTDTKPDAGGDAWTLAAKRGRDGKDFRIVGAAA